MRRKCIIGAVISAIILIPTSIILFRGRQEMPREDTGYSDSRESDEERDKPKKEEAQDTEADRRNPEEEVQNESENVQDTDKAVRTEETGATGEVEEQKKIELTDYAALPVEEFIKETGIPLYKKEEGTWRTEDDTVWVYTNTDDGSIASLSVGGWEAADREKAAYTVAGINLDDDISDLEHTILKDTGYWSRGSGYSDYTGLYLSKLGIETLTLTNSGDGKVDTIYAYFDMSLKEGTEDLEYNWCAKVRQKEGVRNDRLETTEDPYAVMPDRLMLSEEIEKTVVWIRYPSIEIPGKPEMTENINNLILETVDQIEEKTCRKTDENIIVQAYYVIPYMTSKFISITFRVEVKHNGEDAWTSWQYCNINIAKNGEGATLADLGITREDVITACGASQIPLDVEGYLKEYDTRWNQLEILPIEYWIFVPALDRQPDEDIYASVRMNKPRPE